MLFILFILIVCLDLHSQDQPFRFKYFTLSDGLSNSTVSCILQDKTGFLWIGTADGLNRFDGYQFKVYKKKAFDKMSIGENYIRCLYEDSKGNLWIGLLNGIVSKFDPKLETFTNYPCIPSNPKEVNDGEISGITEDKEGLLWIAVDRKGFICLNPDIGSFVLYECMPHNANSLSHNATTSIGMDKDGYLWITTWGGGLDKFDPRSKQFVHYMNEAGVPDHLLCKHLTCQYWDRHGDLWVGTDHGGMYLINTATQKCKQYTNTRGDTKGLNHEIVSDIAEDAQGNLWVATLGNGINIFNRKTKKFAYIVAENSDHGLFSNEMKCLFRDAAGSMWVGTDNGLYFYNSLLMKFNTYRTKKLTAESQADFITSILKDSKGQIWVKGQGGLMKINPEKKQMEQIDFMKSSNPHIREQAMMEDRSGNIWFGYNADFIVKYNPADKRYEQIKLESPWKKHLPFRNVNCFYEDTDGTIWIASEIGTLNYNPETKKFTPLFQSKELIYSEEKSKVVIRDSFGELWIGTYGGLKRYGKEEVLIKNYVTNPDDVKSISSNMITSICEDKKGNLWIGTKNGLNRFHRETDSFSLVIRPGEESGDPVMGIIEDESDHLWISSTIGLIQFNYLSNTFHVYDENNGLQSKEFNQGIFSKGKDGEMLFGGINGFNSFYPDLIRSNTVVPEVYLEDFQIFNKSVVLGDESVLKQTVGQTKKIVLEYWQSMFTFQFVAFNYISPQKNQYAYKLEGFDKQWIYTKADKRYATYTNLSPGNYVFRVRASNNDGVWNEEGTEIEIVILPPLWQTWWAYLIYCLLFVGFFCLILYYFINKEKEKNKIRLERLEARRLHEADQLKLQLFTNISHEFRTSLTLVVGPLDYFRSKVSEQHDSQLLGVMHRNASRLMRLINQLLDFRKIESDKLLVELVNRDIVAFLRELFNTFQYHAEQKNITYSFHSSFPELVMDFDKDKVDKIVYNLLSNAFNYTDESGHITVSLEEVWENDAKHLSIQVADDGIGISAESLKKLFTVFYQADNEKAKYRGGTGLGLNMTKELVQLLGGRISVESEQDQGSVFTVLLPVISQQPEAVVKDEETVLPAESHVAEKTEDTPAELEGDGDSGLILIVEDDSDMRLYIRSILSPEFRIVEAVNGAHGMEKALEFIPDIIVSDVMMPEMNGMELLIKIRDDERISHIPVILLTAVNEEQQILKSFDMGVDDYITKPFSAPILKARVNNILSNRKKLWEKYASLKELHDEASSDYEEKYVSPFVQKMTEIVWKNIADPDFSLNLLSSELCMSSSQLTRKTKALMNITPYNFIIKTRMDYAINEMKQTDKTIAEIALSCGYQEKSNFSRAFTKYIGMNPMQYRKTLHR